MRAKAGVFIFICSLLLVATVSGYLPDTSTITTSNPWIIANGVDQVTITVNVSNMSFGSLQGANVIFSVDNPVFGTINPVTATSDVTGKATCTFKANTKSGDVVISARITSQDGYIVTKTLNQNIDHDSPYSPFFSYPLKGEVASEIPFNVSIVDRWGNRIDDRKEVALGLPLHTLSLHVHGSAPDDCLFVGYGHDISPALDPNGNASVKVKLTSKIGSNYILMDQFGSISDKFEWIVVEATGIPYSMTGTISDGGILPVASKAFIIDYFLYDVYGNPVRNRSIWVNTSLPNEQQMYTSNSLGQIRLSYGPKITINNITITAVSVDNNTVTNQLVAHFINSGPTNMVLAVTPQTMASREVEPSQKAFVRATVIDLLGNPVAGESVRFVISDINNGGFNISAFNGTPSFSSLSVLDNITATTDNDGNAIVYFYPGSFALRTEPGYSKAANASCIVEAQWNSTVRKASVAWKNYPYLSVGATASPQSVRLNETFDISIQVVGDGYAMGGAPVTALLDQDCSASMKNPDSNGLTRLGSAKEAAKAFVDEMKQGQDYIGLISFGTDNNNEFHLAPQADLGLVKTKIDSLLQGKQSKYLGPSITEAMNNITATQPSRPLDEVRAVIVLNDGNSNIDNQGEMDAFVALAGSTNPKIYIFTVVYLDGAPTNDNKKVLVSMDKLANLTGGKLFTPTSPEELRQAYVDIAGILRTLAGVNATMQLNYQNVEVNSTPMQGKDVFDYVPIENAVPEDQRTTILWPNATRSFKNQTDEWNTYNQLHFDIGTINISEQWETTYRLKANQTGLIKLFDNTSTIIFNDGIDLLEFPDLFITVTPNFTPLGSQTGTLDISNLVVTNSGSITDTIPVNWNLKYMGISKVTETMWYSHDNGPWVLFNTQSDIDPGEVVHYAQLDVRKLPPGGYRIKIHAVAPDSIDDEEITAPITVDSKGVFIKLE